MSTVIIRKNSTKTILSTELKDQTFALEKNAKLFYILAINKGNKKPATIRFELNGEGASLEMIGVLYGKNKENFLFKTETIHNGHHTYGHINMKGIMDEEAKTDYFGMIRIPKGIRGADAYLSHHTLLLSKKASARTVPSLEIEANDLKAGHSASVGQIDEEVLFYMMSRSLEESLARKLLIEGFLEGLLQKIPDAFLANSARKAISS